ncbi:RNA polymerase sigma factor [Lentzea tibetensis]|nr:sigma-70 family RNA polymerase sigma factor [Lentzea tibetensis]
MDDLADRLHADAVFVQHFRERGLAEPAWQVYRDQLLGYGLTIVTRLVESGAMFARCRRRGMSLHQQPIGPDETDDLASEVLWAGYELFVNEGLLGGRWSAERGQPLNEYFVNACVLSFPNIYRRWQHSRRGWGEVQLLGVWSQVEQVAATATPEDTVLARAVVSAVFQELGANAHALLILAEQGYSHAEIAEIMRLTPRAVEARIRRARKTARELPDGER